MKCFLIMPFSADFDDVHQTVRSVVKEAIPDKNIECLRLDEIKQPGKISSDLVREIRESTICIADISTNNPNVMWEVGYAMALEKPLILISQNAESLPFDIRDMRTVIYDRSNLSNSLNKKLADVFRATLGAFASRTSARNTVLKPKSSYAIAVTGSMELDINKCRRRLEFLLHTHLSDKTTWYCGSYGDVDETAVEYLNENKQNITVIGYHSLDISPKMLNIIEKNNINFVDASKEQTPKGLRAPSNRDLIYLTRTDLLVVLWNGHSSGTRNLLKWYQEQQKDVLVGFV